MNWYEFVFSEKKLYRYPRHVVFWLVWGSYFFISMSILRQQTGAPGRTVYSIWTFPEFMHGLLTVIIHILATYTFIYFLLPHYLLKAKYIFAISGVILLGVVMVQATRLVDTLIIPFIKGDVDGAAVPYYSSVFSGLISAIKIVAIAAAIKLIKHWWQKQKEKEKLEKEKIETELQLLKAQIHPGFLFNTLNNIYSFSLKASSKAPEMLLRLSDILSYMLYDCDDKLVPLDKEIRMLKDYMSLEKTRFGEKLEMNFQVRGDTKHAQIAPLLLIRFIENSFMQCENRMTEQPWINLEIDLEDHLLRMRLLNGKSPILTSTTDEDDNLEQANRRLQLLYPNNHLLAIIQDAEIMIVNLAINLAMNHKGNEPLLTTDELTPVAHIDY